MKTSKKIKLIKGIVFLILAIIFFINPSIKMVNEILYVNEELDISLMLSIKRYLQDINIYRSITLLDFFIKTWHNYAISGLFAVLGILEMKEGVTSVN